MDRQHDIAVLGASGYTGAELLRYLAQHPSLRVVHVTAETQAGKRVGEVHAHLPAFGELVLAPTDPEAVPDVDLAFLALPHGAAAEIGQAVAERGFPVVDFSADWRLREAKDYETWYGAPHPHPEALGTWTYGLPELYRDELKGAKRVANPGCYPTPTLLALAPLLREGVVSSEGLVIDAASGVSGAGRKVDAGYLYTELEGSYLAYGVTTHRHTPEIEQELSAAAGEPVVVTFTPHLAPMTRGELVTCYARLAADAAVPRGVLESAYEDEPFVHVLPPGHQPATKHTAGSNLALLGVEVDERSGMVVVTCAIDNLGKGAAGQAVQNANLMLGLDETTGLGAQGVFP